MSILSCPFCTSPLTDSGERTYSCENKHSFDIAKQGYINLLPVNQKNSKEPGDNEMMIAARRTFLELGFYDPLVEAIRNLINESLTVENQELIALDAGCGEGYYSEKALNNLPSLETQILGTDISKYAVKLAAKTYKNNFYFVSSVNHLPIADASTDLILSVFAPLAPAEFKRILANNGIVVVVSPAPNHLKEMAELIYEEFRPHSNNVVAKMSADLKHQSNTRCSFKTAINNSNDLLALLKMTPYYWSTGLERLENITKLDELSVSCDFNVDVFIK